MKSTFLVIYLNYIMIDDARKLLQKMFEIYRILTH